MKILVIRRDNIGDLVCTTPLLSCIAQQLPGVTLDVLANEYNYQVLEGNADVRRVWVYKKAKHRKRGQSVFGAWLDSIRLLLKIRRESYDYILIASPGFQASAERFAKYAGGKSVAGYRHKGSTVTLGLPEELAGVGHEVEATLRVASLLGISTEVTPELKVTPSHGLREHFLNQLGTFNGPTIALHISARKPSQRWSTSNFAELARELCQTYGARILLFWSPGAVNDPAHPGDDEKAIELLEKCADIPVVSVKTDNLRELIAALSVAESYIGSDGGAMHLAAGLGLPIIAMFGASNTQRWRPWCKNFICLQPVSMNVSDVSVNDVIESWKTLQKKVLLVA